MSFIFQESKYSNWKKQQRRAKMQEFKLSKELIQEAAELNPAVKELFKKHYPEAFCETAYVSGDMFFHVTRCLEDRGNCVSEGSLLSPIKNKEIDVFSHEYYKYIYVIAHLEASRKYALFNLRSGYHLRRNEIYIRKQGVGIMIPYEHLKGLIKIRSGSGC